MVLRTLLMMVALSVALATFSPDQYYVAVTSSCKFDCLGSRPESPFPNLRRAVKAIQQSSSRPPPFQDIDYEVYVGPGTYFGGENIALILNARAVAITSTHGSSRTVIDCLGEGRFLTLTNASLALTGFTIRNCAHLERGGAVLSLSSTVTMEDVVFENNTANQGGAVFGSGGSFKLISCRLENNKALDRGGALYLNKTRLELQSTVVACNEQQSNTDIYCKLNTTGSIDFASSVSQAGFGCEPSAGCSFIFDSNQQLCGRNATCSQRQLPPPVVVIEEPDNTNATWTLDPDRNQISIPDAKQYASCGDSVCSLQYETCLTCPQDCQQCQFSGIKLSSYVCEPQRINETDCLYRVTSRPTPDIVNFMKGVQGPVTGVALGYFTVPETTFYSFTLYGANVGGRLLIDGKAVLTTTQTSQSFNYSSRALITSGVVHSLAIEFFSFSSLTRNISLTTDLPSLIFYSKNSCGDGILDELEKLGEKYECSSDIDASSTAPNATIQCQDEETIANNFSYCAQFITQTCSPLFTKPLHLPTGTPYSSDTLGSLISNMELWRLPGVDRLEVGFDIIKGTEKLSPLFYFNYCGNNVTNLIQDNYRDLSYIFPEEVFAQPFPQCSFTLDSSSYSSASEVASELTSSSVMSLSVGANGGIPGLFNIAADVAYSEESSVKSARELETKRTGSLLKTEVYCLTSKVQMNKYSFHPVFLKDLSQINTVDDAVRLVEKYGTHYYKSATLGGKLTQITAVDSSFARTKTESELSQSAQLSFHASVSSPVFSAQGSYDQSLDTDITSSEQSTFEEQSSRTRVFTYGGAPGSFGPSATYSAPKSYGEWAATVDLLPVPVKYELDLIANIIPTGWKVNNMSVQDLWTSASIIVLSKYTKPTSLKLLPDAHNVYEVFLHISNALTIDNRLPDLDRNGKSEYFFGNASTFPNFTTNLVLYNATMNLTMLLIDQEGPLGTYSPLRWDYRKGVEPIPALSRYELVGRSLIDINKANVRFEGNISESDFVPQVDYIYIMDWLASKLYYVAANGSVVDLNNQLLVYFVPTIVGQWSGSGLFSLEIQLGGTQNSISYWITFSEYYLMNMQNSSIDGALTSKYAVMQQWDLKVNLGEVLYLRFRLGNADRSSSSYQPLTIDLNHIRIAFQYCSNPNNNQTDVCESGWRNAAYTTVDPVHVNNTYTQVPLFPLKQLLL